MTDPTLADYFFENFLWAWCRDYPSFAFQWLTTLAMGLMVAFLFRGIFFNPDIYFRRQECKKPMPDRLRQWSYALPFYNSRLRNMSTSYSSCLIDNEYDWTFEHPLGYRPNRALQHARPFFWIFTHPRYNIEEPMLTTCSYKNISQIYEAEGYQTVKRMEPWRHEFAAED
jgi:hypothetical protein